MKRVIAIVIAGVMIVVAILVRAALDDDDGGEPLDDTTQIMCVSELREVCRLVSGDAATMDAGDFVTDLGTGEAEANVWVTLAPWPEIANVATSRTVVEDGIPVASTKLAVVVWKSRELELAKQACPTTITWLCLGEAGGTPWSQLGSTLQGQVQVGLPPVKSATGLLLLGNATAGFLDLVDYGINEVDNADGYDSWLAGLRSGQPTADPLNRMLTVGPGAYAAVGTTDARAQTGLGARRNEVNVHYPTPVATVRVVVVPVTDDDKRAAEQLARSSALLDALKDAGFDLPAEDPTGLPTPDVLAALRGL